MREKSDSPLEDADAYILGKIKTHVWSGFSSPLEIFQLIDDLMEGDEDKEYLRASVASEFRRKMLKEPTWPATTDCDRLDAAFTELNEIGIVAVQNAGYTISEGWHAVHDAVRKRGRVGVKGCCFYHGQDLERVVEGGELVLAFGDLDGLDEQRRAIGAEIKACLERHDLRVDWGGDPDHRLLIPQLDWKRRGHPE